MIKDHPDIIAHPPVIVAGTMAAGYLAGHIAGWSLPAQWMLFGWFVTVLGIAIALLAVWRFQKAGTNIIPHKPALILVTGGVYKYTRNPMYIGLLLVHLGLSFVSANVGMLITLPLGLILLHYGVVLREEHYLLSKFGETYSEFLSNSRRWL